MSIVSSLPAEPRSSAPAGLPARPRLTAEQLFARAVIILLGIGVGLVFAVFIAAVSGWIQIRC